MDVFLQTFCQSVAELIAATGKKCVQFSQVSAIKNGVLTCSLYESHFKSVTSVKRKRNFIFMNIEAHNKKKIHRNLYVVFQMCIKHISKSP